MDLFGVGPLELVVVLLVAMIVLGPARMVDMARDLGKFWREAQHALREMGDAATVKLGDGPSAEMERPDPLLDPLPEPRDSVRRDGEAGQDGPSRRASAGRNGVERPVKGRRGSRRRE